MTGLGGGDEKMGLILEVKNLTKKFGGLTAVNDVNFEIKRGELVGLIGPNGAGKTTVFQTVLVAEKANGDGLVIRVAGDKSDPGMTQTGEVTRHFGADLTIVSCHRKEFAAFFTG